MRADGVKFPGTYLRRVEENAGDNGTGVQGYIDSRGYTMAEREWEEFRESVQHARKPAPLRHPAAAVAKSYTEPTPRRAENV